MVLGFPVYMTQRPPQKIHQNEIGFCLFLLLRRHCSLLYPERRRALANERADLRNPSPLGSCTGRERIRFFGSDSRNCSRSSPRRVFHLTLSPCGPTAFVISSSGGSSLSALQPRLSTYFMIWSCYAIYIVSMLELCMLVYVFIIIYFVWNLILQLPIFSTVIHW
jgi:hypothetical protein